MINMELGVGTKGALVVNVVNPENVDELLEFTVNSIVSRRNKDELKTDQQFIILNAYLKYKGIEFKNELYRRYSESKEGIEALLIRKNIYPLPTRITSEILDMFDFQDVFNYVKNIYGVKPPKDLKDTFDEQLEADGRYTRVQTYLKDDYLELVTLTVILKSILPILGEFAYIRSSDLSTVYKEYVLFHFIQAHDIFKTSAMVKLLGLITKLLQVPSNDGEAEAVRVIEKCLAKSDMPIYILATVIVKRLFTSTIVNDTEDENIVNKIYNYVNSKLKNNGDVSKSIRNKTALTDADSSGNPNSDDKESMVESYRILSKLPAGIEVELDFSVNDMDTLIKQIPVTFNPEETNKVLISKDILIHAMEFCNKLNTHEVDILQIRIIACIFKNVIDPRGIEYVRIESIINMFALGFTYLWGLGFKHLALVLSSYVDNSKNDVVYINMTSNRSRITPELKEELNIYFPLKRVVNADTNVNIVEEKINALANEINNKKWIALARKEYLNEINVSSSNFIPGDIKIHLTEFIIKNEKMILANLRKGV